MPKRDNDDVARALEALSDGQHHEEPAHGSAEHLIPPMAPAPAPPKLAQTRPAPVVSGRPPAPTPPRPAAPAAPVLSPKPAAASGRLANPAGARPASVRSAGPPAARPAAPARPAGPPPASRPAAPPARSAAPPAQAAPSNEEAAADDDAVIVPAPDASVFLHKPNYAPKVKRQAFGQTINFKRTLIPILLSSGLIMVALGALHFIWSGENNPLVDLPVWLVGVLFVFGFALWGLAVANMLSVKSAIDAEKARAGAKN